MIAQGRVGLAKIKQARPFVMDEVAFLGERQRLLQALERPVPLRIAPKLLKALQRDLNKDDRVLTPLRLQLLLGLSASEIGCFWKASRRISILLSNNWLSCSSDPPSEGGDGRSPPRRGNQRGLNAWDHPKRVQKISTATFKAFMAGIGQMGGLDRLKRFWRQSANRENALQLLCSADNEAL
eukprot:scaffold1130_cov195-Pinguiococcus_pyrenoidosus.AAC.76